MYMTMDRKAKAASLSVASNTGLVGLKLAVGVATGSVSVISEAAHSTLDLFAAAVAFASVWASSRPADTGHPFGHGKIENVSGVVEAFLILAAAAWIIYEAVLRLMDPLAHPIQALGWGIAVMGASALTNTLVSRYLFKVARETDSIALETDAYHLSTDVWTSLGVFVGLALIQLTGLRVIDPIVAIAVALMIVRVSLALTRKAFGPLLDVGLPKEELRELERIVMRTPKVIGFHKLRTRRSGPYRQIDYHLIVPASMPVIEAHRLTETIEDAIRRQFPHTTVVTHIEPDQITETSKPDTALRHRPITRRRRTPRPRRRNHRSHAT